jgi:hypothetical protein
MSGRDTRWDEIDEATYEAWEDIVNWKLGRPEKNPPIDLKQIARLLRLRQQVPPFVQDFLANLLDPPNGAAERLVLKLSKKAMRRNMTMNRYLRSALRIEEAMKQGKTTEEAIEDEFPGRQGQGFRVLREGRKVARFIEANLGPKWLDAFRDFATYKKQK